MATTLTTDSVRVLRSEQTDAAYVADAMLEQAHALGCARPVGAEQRERDDRGELRELSDRPTRARPPVPARQMSLEEDVPRA